MRELPAIISNSIEAEIHADYRKDNKGVRKSGNEVSSDTLIHRHYGAVELEGQLYRVKTTVKETRDNGNKPYSYEVTKIELLEDKNSSLASEERKGKLSSSEQSLEPTGSTDMSTPGRTANLGNISERRKLSGKEL